MDASYFYVYVVWEHRDEIDSIWHSRPFAEKRRKELGDMAFIEVYEADKPDGFVFI